MSILEEVLGDIEEYLALCGLIDSRGEVFGIVKGDISDLIKYGGAGGIALGALRRSHEGLSYFKVEEPDANKVYYYFGIDNFSKILVVGGDLRASAWLYTFGTDAANKLNVLFGG